MPLAAVERWWLAQILRTLALAFAITAAATSAAYTRDHLAYVHARQGIQSTVDVERLALQTNDRELYDSIVDPRADLSGLQGWLDLRRARADARRYLGLELMGVNVFGELAVATVRVTPPQTYWVPVPFQETRFYRQVDGQWARTVPPDAFWGQSHTLETPHLSFEFFERDVRVVEETASLLDAAYLEIYRTLDLNRPPMEPKLTFVVAPRVVGGWSSSGPRLTVTSPSLLRIPDGASREERFVDAVVGHLVNRALSESLAVSELYHIHGWYNILGGMEQWVRVEVLGRPPYWHEQAEQAMRQEGADYLPFRLVDLSGRGQIGPEQRLLRMAAAGSLVSYAVETFGSEHLLDLLKGFRRYGSWQELVPAVYGIPADTFAAEWNLYLVERYGLDDATP